MPLCRAGELSALWRQGGLENIREQPIEIKMRFQSFADYWDHSSSDRGRPAHTFVVSIATSYRLCETRSDSASRGRRNKPVVLPARVWSVCGIIPDPA